MVSRRNVMLSALAVGFDFKAADAIRDELAAAGIALDDQPGGRTLWRRGG